MEDGFLGQLLLIGLPGTELDAAMARRLSAIQPGGFILFGRNIESPEQLRKLLDDLRDLSQVAPILTIDQEGGRVSRLRLIGREPPSAQDLRQKGDLRLIKRHGTLTGKLLRLFGFNLDLCPVLDVSHDDGADNSLQGRCYGTTVSEVIEKAATFNHAMRKQGILSCGKHFPGYAHASVDAHHQLPIITRSREELEAEELAPYCAMLPDLDSVMVCHTHYTAYDPDRPRWPASLSRNVITQVLRNQLGYDEGLVMTDDLDMGAILNEVPFQEVIRQCILAGNDLAMICHRVEMVEEAKTHLAQLPEHLLDRAHHRIRRFKSRFAAPAPFSLQAFQAINQDIWDLRVATLGEERAKLLSTEDGKRSPVETY